MLPACFVLFTRPWECPRVTRSSRLLQWKIKVKHPQDRLSSLPAVTLDATSPCHSLLPEAGNLPPALFPSQVQCNQRCEDLESTASPEAPEGHQQGQRIKGEKGGPGWGTSTPTNLSWPVCSGNSAEMRGVLEERDNGQAKCLPSWSPESGSRENRAITEAVIQELMILCKLCIKGVPPGGDEVYVCLQLLNRS
jgi:hypothetical protein